MVFKRLKHTVRDLRHGKPVLVDAAIVLILSWLAIRNPWILFYRYSQERNSVASFAAGGEKGAAVASY